MLRSFSEKFINRNFAWDNGTDAVREYLTYILNTPKGTRPYYPHFGSNLHKFKYAPLNQVTLREIHSEIRNCINAIEGMVIQTSEYFVDVQNRTIAFKFYMQVNKDKMTVSMQYSGGAVS